jgi:Flp pilus assembly protein TadG
MRARLLARNRGQSTLEFALVLPIFALVLFGLLDFGRVVYAQNTINDDAREATRIGSVSAKALTTSGAWSTRYAAIRTRARALSAGVALSDSQIQGKSGACPVPADSVTGTCFYPDGVDPASGTVYVTITVQVPIVTPFISNVLGGSITLQATSQTRVHS